MRACCFSMLGCHAYTWVGIAACMLGLVLVSELPISLALSGSVLCKEVYVGSRYKPRRKTTHVDG